FKSNKETREYSREILLKHLTTYQSVYKPTNLDNLNKIIGEEGWKDEEILKEKITKKLIQYISEKGSNLNKEVKEELKRVLKEIEEEELKQTVPKKILLLIGRTGQGKSALANVLSGKENYFKESKSSKSETRSIQVVEFKHEGETYQIVDNFGIGDTQMTESKVLKEISKGYKIIENGIHQVLFVNGERFTPEEIETYNLLKKFFFDENVDKYTTIVRTRFPSFKDQ